jgi:uncharacterized protein with PIN domain
MKFIADRMLGRLSRWLRLFGYDTLEIKKQENEDDLLLELAGKEDRILISRDALLIRKAIKKGLVAYDVQSPRIMEQLREMQSEFKLSFEPRMDRCTLCNSLIRKIDPSEMGSLKTMEYIYPERLDKGTEFWICDKCGQVYWQGSHWKNILERVNGLRNSASGATKCSR